jgi:hypothetical protein
MQSLKQCCGPDQSRCILVTFLILNVLWMHWNTYLVYATFKFIKKVEEVIYEQKFLAATSLFQLLYKVGSGSGLFEKSIRSWITIFRIHALA